MQIVGKITNGTARKKGITCLATKVEKAIFAVTPVFSSLIVVRHHVRQCLTFWQTTSDKSIHIPYKGGFARQTASDKLIDVFLNSN
jgi:hypothetical protein